MKKYIMLFTVQLCTAFSIAMLSVALISIVHNNYGSVSILMLSMALPSIFFGKIIGDFFDKYKKKRLIAFPILFQLLLVLAMLLGDLFVNNILTYLFAFITFSVHIFIDLLLQTSVTKITRESNYLKFNSILSLVENFGIIIGPILGGFFVYRESFHVVLIIIFSFYALILLSAIFYKIPKAGVYKESTEEILSEDNESNSKNKLKQIFYAVALFGFGISIINVVQISFVINRYSTNELGFGLTESAWGLGMAIGAFILLLLRKRFQNNSIFGYSYIAIGVIVSVLIFNPNFYFALLLFLLIGVGNSIISIVSTTLVQLTASSAMLGKSLGMKSMFFQASSLLAMSIVGFLEWTVSPVLLFAVAGVIFLSGGKLVLLKLHSPH